MIERDQAGDHEDQRSEHIGIRRGKQRMPAAQEQQRRHAVTVTMLAYSAMKNEANFMLLYSVWKPATNSFSASGKIERNAIGFGERRQS